MQMPFGKYKGQYLSTLPTDYLEWLIHNVELRDKLRNAVNGELHSRRNVQCKLYKETAHELISAGLRALAKKHHPDVGGDHELMLKINNAADWLRKNIEDFMVH